MGAARLFIVLAIAAVAALALALLVRSISASHKPVIAPVAQVVQQPMTRVLVAKQDLKVADRITADNVAWESWPTGSVNPVFITGGAVPQQTTLAQQATNVLANVQQGDGALQAVSGSLVREPISKNEPITATKLVRGDGSFMAVKLPAGMRAMSVPITAESDAGGFVLPGDRVDVMLAIKAQQGATDQNRATSHLVMRNILVLAVDQNTNIKPDQASMVGATATLQIPADDVDSLSRAQSQGDVVLILRSYADANGPSGRVGPAAADTGDVVRVYRSDQVSEVRVAR